MTHHYMMQAFPGQHVVTRSITDEELEISTGNHGRLALLELINRWNRVGLLGVPNGGPVYVYYAEPN